MDTQIIVILALIFGFYMAWNIGANDVANAFGTVVGSGALRFTQAILIASVFEFAGAFFAGGGVADTIKDGIVRTEIFSAHPEEFARGMLAALLAASIWLNVATAFGQPVSTTHAIIGAIIGFGLVGHGTGCVQWFKLGRIAASWFVSPVVGGTLAFLIYYSIRRFVLRSPEPARRARVVVPMAIFTISSILFTTMVPPLSRWIFPEAVSSWILRFRVLVGMAMGLGAAVLAWNLVRAKAGATDENDDQFAKVEHWFSRMQLVTACYMSFAHGANDVANAIGPIGGVIAVARGAFTEKAAVPMWLLAFGGFGIVVGLATYGYRVIESVGKKITEITPTRGFSAEMGTATTVLVCSLLGLPISTTFVLVGAVMGVGFARGFGAIDLRVIRTIFMSWLTTIPVSGLLAMGIYFLMNLIWRPC